VRCPLARAVGVSAAGVVAAGLVVLVVVVLVVGLLLADYLDERDHQRRMARARRRQHG